MAMTAKEQNENGLKLTIEHLKVVIISAQKLLLSLGNVMKMQQKIESQLEEIETVEKPIPNIDPDIAEEIRELKRSYRSSINCAKQFFRGCLSTVEYGLNEKIEKAIKEELEQGKLDNLTSFLHFLEKRLQQCKDKLEKFHCSQSEANDIAKKTMKRNKEKLNKATREANTAKGQLESASLVGSVFTGAQLLSGIAVVGGLMTMGSLPQTGLVMTITSIAVGFGSLAMADAAELHGLEAKNDLKSSMKEQSSFKQALHSIKDIEILKMNEKQIPITAEFKDISSGLDSLHITMRFMWKDMEGMGRVSAGTEIGLQPKLYPSSEIHSSSLDAQKITLS